MFLGLGYGELILLIGTGSMLLGQKDLVKISGYSGRVVGWMVGYLQLARGQLQDIGAASEMSRMHHEMQVNGIACYWGVCQFWETCFALEKDNAICSKSSKEFCAKF